LVDGDENNANYIATIAQIDLSKTNIDAYQLSVPTNLLSKSDYFLRMAAVGPRGEKSYNFSARFKIIGGSPTEKATVEPSPTKESRTTSTPSSSVKATDSAGDSNDASMKSASILLTGVLGAIALL
jgi:hypothetical protein